MRWGLHRQASRRRPSRWGSRIRLPVLLLAVAVLYGTIGYRIVEGFSFVDSLYMTVTGLTTVGFGEVHPLSPAGRVFTVTLIVLGLVAFFDLLAVFTGMLASGRLGQFLERKAMQHRIDALSDHYVICAYGRVGRAAAQELGAAEAPLVVIESKPELEDSIVESGLPYVMGDPSDESVLRRAGIGRAKALLCAVDSDAINVYITLTARALNPNLFVIARASSTASVATLRRAGCDRVISPYTVSGTRMARLALQPAVVDLIDMVAMAPDLRIEELVVAEGSALAGGTIRDACAPRSGVMLVAVKNSQGDLRIPPRADDVLDEGDLLIAVGLAAPLDDFTRLATRRAAQDQ